MKKTFALIALFLIPVSLFFSSDFSSKGLERCPFCQEEVIQRQLFYQGKEILGIATHKPAATGHVLIIPLRHVERFEELSPSEVAEMGQVIQKIDRAVRHLHGTTGYLLIQKNGQEAGQSVPHVHFHYIPVTKGDSQIWLALKFFLSPWFSARTAEEMKPQIVALSNEMEL